MRNRLIKFVLVSLVLILNYTNCSRFDAFGDYAHVFKSNNGKPYDGMSNAYYRFIPNYSCSGTPGPIQVATTNGDDTILYSNSTTQCDSQGMMISNASVDSSPFESEFISIKDALFEKYAQTPGGIPSNLAEILCRDNFDNPSFEIVAHYDSISNQALGRSYSAQESVPDFSVSRILSVSSVQYVSSQFTLNVDLSAPSQSVKKFAGQILNSSLSGVKPTQVTCVIGGALDTSNWTVNVLSPSNSNASRFHMFDTGEIFLFSSTTPTNSALQYYPFFEHIISLAPNGSGYDFSKKNFGDDSSFQNYYTLSDNNFAVIATSTETNAFNLNFLYNSKTGVLNQLTNLDYDPSLGNNQRSESQIETPQFSSNGHLIYGVMPYNSGFLPGYIRDFDPTTAKSFDFGKSFFYSLLPRTNKVLYPADSLVPNQTSFQIYDMNTHSSKAVVLKTDSCQGLGDPLAVFNDEQSVVVTLRCNDGSENDLAMVSLKDNSFKIFAKNKAIVWTSDDRRWVLLGSFLPVLNPVTGEMVTTLTDTNLVAYNVSTGQSWPVPVGPNYGVYTGPGSAVPLTTFSGDILGPKISLVNDQFLYGFAGDLNHPTLYQTDLSTGVVTAVCKDAVGLNLFISSFSSSLYPSQEAYLFSYDLNLKVYHFYRVKPDGTCNRINEFPSNYPSVVNLTTTNIGFGLSLNLGNDGPVQELVFVPINGQPPKKLNDNTSPGWSFQISLDHNEMYVVGPNSSGKLVLKSYNFNSR